jgi:hypothetical protein
MSPAGQHVPAKRVGFQTGPLLGPAIVLASRIDLALPPGDPAKVGLEHVDIDAAACDFIDRRSEQFRPERIAPLVPGTDAGDGVRRIVAVKDAKRRLASFAFRGKRRSTGAEQERRQACAKEGATRNHG